MIKKFTAKQIEIMQINAWFKDYDKKVSEHLRCARLNIECHHNIDELDSLAEEKKQRLNVLKNGI